MAEPSAYFRQHYAVDEPLIDGTAFRQWFKVRHHKHLDGLVADSAITETEYRAGVAFFDIAERVMQVSWPTSNLFKTGHSRGGFDGGIVARQDAINRLHELHAALGTDAIDLLEAHIVRDMDWTELGQRLGVHAKTARSRTIAVLRVLATVIWKK